MDIKNSPNNRLLGKGFAEMGFGHLDNAVPLGEELSLEVFDANVPEVLENLRTTQQPGTSQEVRGKMATPFFLCDLFSVGFGKAVDIQSGCIVCFRCFRRGCRRQIGILARQTCVNARKPCLSRYISRHVRDIFCSFFQRYTSFTCLLFLASCLKMLWTEWGTVLVS